MALHANHVETDAGGTYSVKLRQIVNRVKAEKAVAITTALLYRDVADRLAQYAEGKTWSRSQIYAVLAGQNQPGRVLAEAIDRLLDSDEIMLPAPACADCGVVHVRPRCPKKKGSARRRIQIKADVDPELKKEVQRLASEEGVSVSAWINRVVAEAAAIEETK